MKIARAALCILGFLFIAACGGHSAAPLLKKNTNSFPYPVSHDESRGQPVSEVFPDAPYNASVHSDDTGVLSTSHSESVDSEVRTIDSAGSTLQISALMISGVWNAIIGQNVCRIATPQTKFGPGFRAGPLRCLAPFDRVRSWNVVKNQLVFYDEDGLDLVHLEPVSRSQFKGSSRDGAVVLLIR